MSVRLLRAPLRVLAVLASTTLLLVVGALPAGAHVTVSSPDAKPGGFGKLVFRVPTESDTASTVKLSVTLPEETPFAFVSTKALPGWTAEITKKKLDKPVEVGSFTLTEVASTVTWTAQRGEGVRPEQFDEFELSVGPFPEEATTIELPAVQTYDDGEVARWDETATEEKAEPEHPAPTLDLAAADGPADEAPTTTSGDAVTADSSDGIARTLAGIGALVALAALAVSLLLLRRRPA